MPCLTDVASFTPADLFHAAKSFNMIVSSRFYIRRAIVIMNTDVTVITKLT